MKKFILISLCIAQCGLMGLIKAAAHDAPLPQNTSLESAIQKKYGDRYKQRLNLISNITLNNSQIAAIPANFHVNFPKLTVLFLSHNQINAIPAGFYLRRLETLFLNDNQINAIPNGLYLPALKKLNLANNQINAIPANLNLPQLKEFDLSYNQIVNINPQIFQQLPQLKELNVRGNDLNPENITALRNAANETGRTIKIITDEIGN